MTAENKDKGFIKIYRSIESWDWWDDINTFRLFVTILIRANWKNKKWRGKKIKRGQLWTSLESLSQMSGLSIQEVRTSLGKLKATNEITIKATNEGRLITVENYDFYQDDDRIATNETTSELTDEQQTINKPSTTTKEVKEYKELNNVVVAREDEDLRKRLSPSDIDSLYDRFPSSAGYLIETVAKEVRERKRKVKKPVPYILEYAKRVGWDDGAEHFREPWFE